jgi:hypothetical protein
MAIVLPEPSQYSQQMWTRRFLGLVLLAATVTAPGSGLDAQTATEPTPVTYICAMDAEVLETHPGPCPVCGMKLQAVKVEPAWACPRHRAVTAGAPGRCPLDGGNLVPVTVNHFWFCADEGLTQYTAPGKCAAGRARQERRVVRIHGDHNPRHGGQFTMSADQVHHVEGTYPSAGIFRLYVYDSYTQPLSPVGISGRVFTNEAGERELNPVTLSPGRNGTLEARISESDWPVRVAVQVKFSANEPEQRFDFTFGTLTREPGTVLSGSPAAARASGSAPRPVLPAVSPGPVRPASAPAPITTSLADDTTEVLRLLQTRTEEIRTMIDEGNFVSVYVPTMIAKDVALQLADRPAPLTTIQHDRVRNAVQHIVVAAWTLDRYGDAGNREELSKAQREFARWVGELSAVYGTR